MISSGFTSVCLTKNFYNPINNYTMQKTPIVSILVPIYGVENFIEKCAVSLFEQTYQNIEYIFVDDCSKDNSINVLRNTIAKYPDREKYIHVITHDKNRGLSAARNTAVAASNGGYLMHVDSDDYIDLDCVEKAVGCMLRNNADAVVFGMKHIFKDKIVTTNIQISEDKNEYVASLIRREQSVCVCGALYSSNLYKNYGVKSIEGVNFGEDYAVKPRIMYFAKKVACLNEPLYNYIHFNSESYTSKFNEKNIDDQKIILKKLSAFFLSKNDASFFKQSIDYAKVRVKAELLISWGIGKGTKEQLKMINEMKQPICHSFLLCKQYKIALALSYFPFLLKSYSVLGVKIKRFLK